MEELQERIDLLFESGFVDEVGKRDLETIVHLCVDRFGLPCSDDALGALVTHVAAALKRAATGEKIDPLAPVVVDEVRKSDVYPRAKEVQGAILDAMESKLSADEQDFVLVHVGTVLAQA